MSANSQDLTEEVINGLERLEAIEDAADSHLARELTSILCKEDFEGLLCAHDKIARRKMEPRASPGKKENYLHCRSKELYR